MADDPALQVLHGIYSVQFKIGARRIDSYDLSS